MTMPRRRAVRPATPPKPRGMTEKHWAAVVVRIARLHGWDVFWTWNSRHTPAGEPDLRMLKVTKYPDRHVGRYLLAELKTDAGKLTTEQQRVASRLWCCAGVEFYVWRPKDLSEVIEVLAAEAA